MQKQRSNTTIAISTYQKSDGLDELLASLLEHDYGEYTTLICDDFGAQPYQVIRQDNPGHRDWNLPENSSLDVINKPSALEIYKKYKDRFRHLVFLHGKERGGVSINKNRGIWYFLNKTQDDYLLLLDDDLLFHSSGMVEDWIEVLKANTSNDPITGLYSLDHLTGTWTDYDPDFFDKLKGRPMIESRKAWDADFPVEALGQNGLEWRRGCQGCSCFFTRKAVEAVGFYDLLTFYAFEHSLYSSRVMLKVNRRSPILYPVFDYSGKYYIGNGLANNYNDSKENADAADPMYQARLNNEIARGLRLKVKEPGFDPTEETILE